MLMILQWWSFCQLCCSLVQHTDRLTSTWSVLSPEWHLLSYSIRSANGENICKTGGTCSDVHNIGNSEIWQQAVKIVIWMNCEKNDIDCLTLVKKTLVLENVNTIHHSRWSSALITNSFGVNEISFHTKYLIDFWDFQYSTYWIFIAVNSVWWWWGFKCWCWSKSWHHMLSI